MSSSLKSRSAFGLSLRLLGVVVLAAGLALWLYGVQQRWTSRYWQQRLETVNDEEAPALVRQIAAAGDQGIPVLVFGLRSPRELVRRECRLALDEELNRWARMPRAAASAKLGILAASLADEAEAFDATSRVFAADLVSRILLWPTDESVLERSQLVADCERALRLGHLDADQQADRWQRRHEAALSAQIAADLKPSSLPVVGRSELPLAKLAPPELPPMSTVLDDVDAAQTMLASAAAPHRLSPGQSFARRLAPPSAAVHAAANQAAYLADGGQQDASSSDEEEARSASGAKLREQNAIQLFALLAHPGAGAAEAELKRRGFGPAEIEAGKHLTSENPDERRRWTEALPGMRGVDAKSWLLWLSRDPDAAVRCAAVTLMATSQDPQMLRRVEQVSREDADPATREQAARIIGGDSKARQGTYAR
ncbi:MAG TPA: HEAT repeat domain-containing protein [Pirellulales bacterium]|nr:HEAT repeat domain-containing protein [Pirellulales bacterium]